MDIGTLGLLLGGAVLLIVGAELLVRGASRLATIARISPLVIGLTVVAFGTSAPELAVSVQAGLAGNSSIAMANVVGSNIFNVLFILGICALIYPLTVAHQLVRLDIPLVISASLLVLVLALDGRLGVLDGVLLTTSMVIYIVWMIRKSHAETKADDAAEQTTPPQATAGGIAIQLALLVGGLALLVLGSRWLVSGAVSLAEALGISEAVIGLTIVAIGTSLPEVATSIMATLRKERDIAVGNVVGSNLFNLLSILGIASIVTPGGIEVPPTMLRVDLVIMIAVAVAALPIFFTGYSIDRWEGALFLGGYIAYTIYLIFSAINSDLLPTFNGAMLFIVFPLVTLALGVQTFRSMRDARRLQEVKE